MENRIDLVLCKFDGCDKSYLFKAPAYCGIEAGDEVVVDTVNGYERATVQMTDTVDITRDEYMNTVNVCGATLPLMKVVKRVIYRDVEWEDGSDEQD